MSISGFSVMNPISTMSMVDTARWRPVVYADTPRTIARFRQFLESKKPDSRKTVLFVFGSFYLQEVLKHKDKFNTMLVFDDVQNLGLLVKQVPGVQIVDIEKDKDGGFFPKYLTPADLMEIINQPTNYPSGSVLLTQVTRALSQRKPSVLETTSRLPVPEAVPESGSQRMLADLKQAIPQHDFALVLDVYTKYLFRIVSRSYVTKEVTKKLPTEAKDQWKQALDFADSDIGLEMAKAYHALCRSSDPDFRAGHAVNKFKLKAYSGDFLYFTSVLPPHQNCQFLPDVFPDDSVEQKPLVALIHVPEPVAATSKPKGKKSKA
jgi:hypothetical protein